MDKDYDLNKKLESNESIENFKKIIWKMWRILLKNIKIKVKIYQILLKKKRKKKIKNSFIHY